ncbi:MAG: 16S rRNA (uracil(1498)-N(3))-methyltransferase [Oscillospiraceae bacterium]|nr:16S rRNA (uracil(1498)-N(3))-methyltransferase [Oscillospiraceae bacterium]
MPRFFADVSSPDMESFILSGDAFNHIKVLRLRVGDELILCDGRKTDYVCVIEEISSGSCHLKKLSSAPSVGEPDLQANLFLAFSKGDKMEFVIQKAVELGVHSVTAFPSRRCVSVPDAKSVEKKLVRWNKIALEAAMQCGRGIVPEVKAAANYAQALKLAGESELSVFLYEDERDNGYKNVLSGGKYNSVSLIIGPEGGFDPDEAKQAVDSGCVSASLGPRILRCETAPICALSALMFHTDNL